MKNGRVVGGMPQAVDAYVSGKSYEQIDFVKRNILSLYEENLLDTIKLKTKLFAGSKRGTLFAAFLQDFLE